MNNYITPGERLDDLQIDDLKIIQNPKWFCFGMDAVLLSGFINIKKGSKVIDLGCGNGVIPLLLSAKTQALHITGIEIQQQVAEMAQRSVRMNKLEHKITIVNEDLKKATAVFGKASFDVVVTNPPYRTKDCGIENPADVKAIARHEIMCSLEDVIRTTGNLLKPEGKLFMVHRPDRMADIICLMREYKIEPKRLRFVHPRKEEAPNMILIEGLKDGGRFLKIEKPLYIYGEGTAYSQDVQGIYENKNTEYRI